MGALAARAQRKRDEAEQRSYANKCGHAHGHPGVTHHDGHTLLDGLREQTPEPYATSAMNSSSTWRKPAVRRARPR